MSDLPPDLLNMHTSAVDDSFLDDTDSPFADLFAQRREPAPSAGDPTREGSPVTDPEPEPSVEPTVAGDDPGPELTAEQQAEMRVWLERMQQIPQERVAALDYFLATGELPAELAPRSAPPAPAPEPDPVAQIDFRALEDNLGREAADAIRTLAERTRAQEAELARAREQVQATAQASIEEMQRRQAAEIDATINEFGTRHNLDAATLEQVTARAAEMRILPALQAQGLSARDAVTRALDIAVRTDDQFLEKFVADRVAQGVAAATERLGQRAERKQLASQVAGVAGSAPRTTAPMSDAQIRAMTPEQRRAAMVEAAREAFSANA